MYWAEGGLEEEWRRGGEGGTFWEGGWGDLPLRVQLGTSAQLASSVGQSAAVI